MTHPDIKHNEMMAESAKVQEKVEYRIFPLIPQGLDIPEQKRHLEEQIDKCLAVVGSHIFEYIWQNEGFSLRVVCHNGSLPGHLYGCTDYGDCVEDEWFIVFLLLELTKHNQDLVVQVWDHDDGEFLLIEAADYLPRWLKPETTENRVFLHNGRLHIIPLPQSPADIGIFPSTTPALPEALDLVLKQAKATEANSKIQKAIMDRLHGYPEKMSKNNHRTHCYVPANLAAVLKAEPQLIAPIVNAFYVRDPIDLKACVTFRTFLPGTRVMTDVRMTRCHYAQLTQQKFEADKRSGFNLPNVKSSKYKAYSLGMKLAHGAEILCSRCGRVSDDDEDVDRSKFDVRWHRFVNTLSEKGYFKGLLEGSKQYTELLDSAKNYFYKTAFVGEEVKEDNNAAGLKMLRMLKKMKVDVEEWKQLEASLPAEDDDSWINVAPEDFEKMLQNASSQQGHGDFDLSSISKSMKEFVEASSSHEGAEFPKGTPGSRDSGEISFEPNSFMRTMQQIFEDNDSSSASSSDMDEYASDDDLAEYEPPPPRHVPKPTKGKESEPVSELLKIQDYMDIMDRELAQTNVGKSFEREEAPKAPPRRKRQSQQNTPNNKNAATPSGAASNGKKAPKAALDDDDDDEDDFRPVDVNMTLVKNLLESHSAQEGLAGPTSNILKSMGLNLPQDDD